MPSSALEYELRIRDLVHGFVYLTSLEVRVINHCLFQRLRHVRQNDVAFFVYPSLNTSRFEHSLGCLSVAGRMAVNLVHSPGWEEYRREVGLDQSGFEQLCRLYALMHDVGHLPLSHLFEIAFEDFAAERSVDTLCREWFGGEGFFKLHEACGFAIAQRILQDISMPSQLRDHLLHLMGTKDLRAQDPLRPIKLLVDHEIDADRIDSTARDGMLAGGEYGSYDIDRICSAVFLQQHEPGWRLAYSHKALGSIESLLLDRYRTYRWIHYHHQVVAMKAAVMILLSSLLAEGVIGRESFSLERSNEFALRDDIWLWSVIRGSGEMNRDEPLRAVRDFVLFRDKRSAGLLWKHRPIWRQWYSTCLRNSGRRSFSEDQLGREYESFLTESLGFKTIVYVLRFSPVETEGETLHLTDEEGRDDLGDLLGHSQLLRSLPSVWREEPQFYIVIFGQVPSDLDPVRRAWVTATADWVSRG